MTPFDQLLVDGLPLAVLIVFFSRIIFRPVTFEQSIQRMKIMLLIHWTMVALWCVFLPLLMPEEPTWFQSEHPSAYTLSLLTNLLLLPLLFVKPFSRKLWFVMMMSVVANIKNIFFLLVTILQAYDGVIPEPEIEAAISGLVVGFVLVIVELAFRKKALQSPNAFINRWSLFLLMSTVVLCGISYHFGDQITSLYCCHNFDPPPYA